MGEASRQKTGARERILDTAQRLFYARGIRSVGVDTIIMESGVAKASLYKHFPAKEDLVIAYLGEVDDVWTGQLQAAAGKAGDDPADQLVGLFDALSSVCRSDGYRGCAFINATGEYLPGTPVHDRVVAHRRRVREWIHGLAVDTGAADPQALTTALIILLDGGLVGGSMNADPSVPATAKQTAAGLVAAALA